ncbi:hypothetical protein J6T93_05040 [bacterium]|nr:hypothetical protein [bacterium]
MEKENVPEEVEVFRHSRRRSRYHAMKAERKEKIKKGELERFQKRDPRPRSLKRGNEEEEW